MPSSAISSYHYDAERQQLFVTFVTGRRYAYYCVPPEAYDAFRAAFSKGRHFNIRIRDAYEFAECTAQPADA